MPAVANALAPFSARLLALSGTYPTQLTDAWTSTQYFDPVDGGFYADLKDYAYCFYDPNGVSGFTPEFRTRNCSRHALQLENAISNAVIENDASPDLPGAFGMSIYFPRQKSILRPIRPTTATPTSITRCSPSTASPIGTNGWPDNRKKGEG